MMGSSPLVLVIVTMIMLWLLGKMLTRAETRLSKVQTIHNRMQALKKTSLELFPGLHVGGLSKHQVDDLKKFLRKNDELELSLFLALYRPVFFEFEDLITNLRQQFSFLLGAPADEASEFDKISAANSLQLPDHPEAHRFKVLSSQELRLIVEKEMSVNGVIDEAFVDKFGGLLFMENFIMYDHLCREEPAIFHIPESSELKHLYDTFVTNGVASRGRDIGLELRLHILSLEQLKTIAKEAKINKPIQTKLEGIQALKDVPSAAVLLATIYPTNELYLLHSEERDVKAVEQEWAVLNIYAKLLFTEPKSSLQIEPVDQFELLHG